MFKFWLRWGIYSAIAFLTMLAVVSELFRMGSMIIVIGYALYLGADTFRQYVTAFDYNHNQDKSLLMAVSNNAIDIVFIIMALVIGLSLGGVK